MSREASPLTVREGLKQLGPGQSCLVPVPRPDRERGLRRLASIARNLWGNGGYRVAQVAGGVYVQRLRPAPEPAP